MKEKENGNSLNWDVLLMRIKKGQCTPFLGAGACAPTLKVGAEIARTWAERHQYPLGDPTSLPSVAQFVAIKQGDAMAAKELLIAEFLEGIRPPSPQQQNEPHNVLAKLPLPLYITTNYDDFMVRALRRQEPHAKLPVREICRWNTLLENRPSVFDDGAYTGPTPERPIVFHLHGHSEIPESMVLTEDDYLDFLVNISRDPDLIPVRIREAFTGTSLLFLGYSLADPNFRVIFRGLVNNLSNNLRRTHVSVQLAPKRDGATERERKQAQTYLGRYFDSLSIQVYWGTCDEFLSELSQRWQEFHNGH